MSSPSSASISHAAHLLALPLPQPPAPHTELHRTILSELLPDSPLPATLPHLALRAVGFNAPVCSSTTAASERAISAFLLTTLQTHRMLQATQPPSRAPNPHDDRLTASLSRILAALRQPPPPTASPSTAQLAALLRSLAARLAATHPPAALLSRLGAPLLPRAPASRSQWQQQQLAALLPLSRSLWLQHALRARLLATRLRLTQRAFARAASRSAAPLRRSQRARLQQLSARAAALCERAERAREHHAVSLYEAQSARAWLLAPPPTASSRASHPGVKQFVMGAVPHRGGRPSAAAAAAAAAAAMPRFRERAAPFAQRHAAQRAPSPKSKPQRKRKHTALKRSAMHT